MAKQKYITGMYVTAEGVDVTKRIEQAKTMVFDTEPEAYRFANQKRSYQYPLYKLDKNGKRTQIGFAVPK